MDISQASLKKLYEYDPETGKFIHKVDVPNGIKRGSLAGATSFSTREGKTTLSISIGGGIELSAGRLAWLYVHGILPEMVDYKDGDRTNVKIANLEVSSQTMRMQLITKPSKNNVSGYRGVSWSKDKNKFKAAIKANGRYKFLGYFDTAAKAHAAYVQAKLELHAQRKENAVIT